MSYHMCCDIFNNPNTFLPTGLHVGLHSYTLVSHLIIIFVLTPTLFPPKPSHPHPHPHPRHGYQPPTGTPPPAPLNPSTNFHPISFSRPVNPFLLPLFVSWPLRYARALLTSCSSASGPALISAAVLPTHHCGSWSPRKSPSRTQSGRGIPSSNSSKPGAAAMSVAWRRSSESAVREEASVVLIWKRVVCATGLRARRCSCVYWMPEWMRSRSSLSSWLAGAAGNGVGPGDGVGMKGSR